MNTVLFTVHGSHLYGLDHEDSDYDTYRVVLDGLKGNSYFVTYCFYSHYTVDCNYSVQPKERA